MYIFVSFSADFSRSLAIGSFFHVSFLVEEYEGEITSIEFLLPLVRIREAGESSRLFFTLFLEPEHIVFVSSTFSFDKNFEELCDESLLIFCFSFLGVFFLFLLFLCLLTLGGVWILSNIFSSLWELIDCTSASRRYSSASSIALSKS